ncbi:transmembrane protein, putative [Medicago truncatula]|uniref:Transmembrane protein, putative n=1 Tax=Medicago truncatula TaxID=3880 RepID=G7JBF7_MEDTR|nr:transmembrane protein, putative [Medicago truncatula]
MKIVEQRESKQGLLRNRGHTTGKLFGLTGSLFVGVRRLEVRRIREFNIALLGKWGWRCLVDRDSLWYRVLSARYGEEDGRLCQGGRDGSLWWRDIYQLCEEGWFNSHVSRSVGNGKNTLFWTDVWVGGVSLHDRFSRLFQLSTKLSPPFPSKLPNKYIAMNYKSAPWKQKEFFLLLTYAFIFYDVSDARWRNFRGNLPVLTLVFLIFTLMAHLMRAFFNFNVRGMCWNILLFIIFQYHYVDHLLSLVIVVDERAASKALSRERQTLIGEGVFH